jgi:hypothetical protein
MTSVLYIVHPSANLNADFIDIKKLQSPNS